MENEQTRPDEPAQGAQDESAEAFREDVESDPSTADAAEKDDTDLDRLRGG